VCADGIVLESFGLVLDEASLTGEGDPIHKEREEDPWVRSGTQVRVWSGWEGH
jgi:Ca2+-transporting ATPase